MIIFSKQQVDSAVVYSESWRVHFEYSVCSSGLPPDYSWGCKSAYMAYGL